MPDIPDPTCTMRADNPPPAIPSADDASSPGDATRPRRPATPSRGSRPARPQPVAAGRHRDDARSPRTARRDGRLLTAALTAVARGWFVFPVHPGSKIPAVTTWETAATRDPQRIREWWSTAPYNIGIACGPSRLLVVDVDSPATGDADRAAGGGAPGADEGAAPGGADGLARRAADVGGIWPPRTYTVSTPRGGSHWYFRVPAGLALRNTQGSLAPAIDTRAGGGFVVGAGSVIRQGRRYRVTANHRVLLLPGWLAAELTPPPAQNRPPADPSAAPPHVHAGSRRRVQAYLAAVVAGEAAAVANAAEGTRHTTLLGAARRLGHWVGGGLLPEHQARAVLTRAARHFVGVGGYTARQVERDIDDGLAYGARLPRGADFITARD